MNVTNWVFVYALCHYEMQKAQMLEANVMQNTQMVEAKLATKNKKRQISYPHESQQV